MQEQAACRPGCAIHKYAWGEGMRVFPQLSSLLLCRFAIFRMKDGKNWRVLGSHPVPVRRGNGARSPLSRHCRTAKAALGPESCSQQGTEASRDVGDIYGFKSLHRDIMALP